MKKTTRGPEYAELRHALAAVASRWSAPIAELLKPRPRPQFREARLAAIYVAWKSSELSPSALGRLLDLGTPAQVASSCRAAREAWEQNPFFLEKAERAINQVRERPSKMRRREAR